MADRQLAKVFAPLLAFVGAFALIGGLYSWGAGPIWEQDDSAERWLQWTDLLVTTPLCWLAAWGIWRWRWWMPAVTLMTCGVLFYGSVAVFVQLAVSDAPPPITWILPPLGGLALAGALVVWLTRGSGDEPYLR